MTPRERFLTAVSGGQPDRVPLYDFLFSPMVYEAVNGHPPQGYTPRDVMDCTRGLGLDAAFFFIGAPRGYQVRRLAPNLYLDEWSTTIQENPAISWPGGPPVDFPVKTREDWQNYAPPDIHAPGRTDDVLEALRRSKGEIAILGGVLGPLTAAWQIMGLENFMLKLYDDPTLVHQVLRTVTDYFTEAGRLLWEAGVDALLVADDHASTSGPFMSLAHFREFVLPYFTEMVRTFRGWGARVIMHNDGDLRLYLDDLVATGINAYHPVERAAGMDLATVKTRYGLGVCLIGNIDNKGVLVRGTPEEVEAAVLECLRVGAPGGGYVLASDHSLHDDMPLENVFRMFETARRYGHYPLRLPE